MERLREGDVRALARAVSVVENRLPGASGLIAACREVSGSALRIGITGPPGAGKSTLVDQIVRHLRAVGVDPTHVLDVDGFVHRAGEEARPSQNGVATTQPHQLTEEFGQTARTIGFSPVEPADLVVQRISVIVAALRALSFVAGEHHGSSLSEKQRREDVAHLTIA